MYALLGVKVYVDAAADEGHYVLYTLIPQAPRVVLWMFPALLACIAAFRPKGRDGFGFVALIIPTTIVAFSYVWSFVGYLLGSTEWTGGLASAAIWVAMLALILLISGWREPITLRELNE